MRAGVKVVHLCPLPTEQHFGRRKRTAKGACKTCSIAGLLPGAAHWGHGEEVPEGGAVLAVVEQAGAHALAVAHRVAQLLDSLGVCPLALQEAAAAGVRDSRGQCSRSRQAAMQGGNSRGGSAGGGAAVVKRGGGRASTHQLCPSTSSMLYPVMVTNLQERGWAGIQQTGAVPSPAAGLDRGDQHVCQSDAASPGLTLRWHKSGGSLAGWHRPPRLHRGRESLG